MAVASLSAGYSAVRALYNPSRRRIHILPTLAGLLYACTLLIMLIGAINYDNSLAYALTFLIACLMPIVILHTYRNLVGLAVITSPPQPVFAGDKAYFPVTLDNRGRSERFALELRRQRSDIAVSIDLGANRLQTVDIPVAAHKRGRLALGQIRVSSCFPLGLFRTWTTYTSSQIGVVYPRPAGRLPLPTPSDYQGEDQCAPLSGTEDFIGFRNYQPGDSIRSIYWKAVARGQDLLIKRFSGGDGGRQLDLHWDLTRPLCDTEARLSQLCLWVIEAEQRGLRYRLCLPRLELPLDHGPQHQQACLTALALFE